MVKHLTLDFGSGHDFMVCGIEPHVELCTDSAELAWDSLSPSLSASPLFTRMLSLSKQVSIFFLMFIFERERRERVQAGKGERERETQNLEQAPGSKLPAQSPMQGWNSQTARSCPKLKSDT